MIERGDIRWYHFSASGKRRPVVVLGRDEILPSLAQIPVIPLSTQIRGLPWEVQLSAAEGLPGACVLKPEWMRSVERSQLGPQISSFPAHRWPELRRALMYVLGLDL